MKARWVMECKNRYKCSSCNVSRNTETQIGWNFCPHCGSEMDDGLNGKKVLSTTRNRKVDYNTSSRTSVEGDNLIVRFPCKPGDTLYLIQGAEIVEDKCTGFWVGKDWVQIQMLAGRVFTCWDGTVDKYFNKEIFTNKELATKELERRQQLD